MPGEGRGGNLCAGDLTHRRAAWLHMIRIIRAALERPRGKTPRGGYLA